MEIGIYFFWKKCGKLAHLQILAPKIFPAPNSLSQQATKNEMEVLKKGLEPNKDCLKKDMEANLDGLKKGMEAKMDGMEANMEDMKNDIKEDMEGLTKLIQEMIPNGENVVEETYDENKINVNCDFINSNVGLKTHHIPKMDMRKFDGKDPVTWILHMEQYFDLLNVQNTQNVRIANLHLEKNTFVWY